MKDSRLRDINRKLDEYKQLYETSQNENRRYLKEKKEALAERDAFESSNQKLTNENQTFLTTNKTLESENARQRQNNNDLRKSIEKEAMLRVQLENRLQSQIEKLEFTEKIHADELKQFASQDKIGYTDSQVQSKIASALEEVREEHTIEMETSVNKLHYSYKVQIENLEAKLKEAETVKSESVSGMKSAQLQLSAAQKSSTRKLSELERDLSSKIKENDRLKEERDNAMVEKENLEFDLQSRKEVYTESEAKMNAKIKELEKSITEKEMAESKLRAELASFGVIQRILNKKF